MQNNQVNIAFNQMSIEAFSLGGQGTVKDAHWVVLCVRRAFTSP